MRVKTSFGFLAGLFISSSFVGACSTPYQRSANEFGMERTNLLAVRIDEARDRQLDVPRSLDTMIRAFEAAAEADAAHRVARVHTLESRYYTCDEVVWQARKSLSSITDVWGQLREEPRAANATSDIPRDDLEHEYEAMFAKLIAADQALRTNFQQFTDALAWMHSAEPGDPRSGEWLTRLTIAREQTLSAINRTVASLDAFDARLNAAHIHETRTAAAGE